MFTVMIFDRESGYPNNIKKFNQVGNFITVMNFCKNYKSLKPGLIFTISKDSKSPKRYVVNRNNQLIER